MKAQCEDTYYDRNFDKAVLLECYKDATIKKNCEITIPNHSFVLYLTDENEDELDLRQIDLETYKDIIKEVLVNLPDIDKKVNEYFDFSSKPEHNHHLTYINIEMNTNKIFLNYCADHYNSELGTYFVKENGEWVMIWANGKDISVVKKNDPQ